MLDWSIEQNEHPVMILIPGNGVINDNTKRYKEKLILFLQKKMVCM